MNRVAEPGATVRTLIHILIIHTQADMGSLRESVQRVKVQKLGRQVWKRNVNLIEKMWTEIEKAIDGLALPYKRVRVYQDALPVCGREVEIVTELAKAGSRNHQFLLRLKERGAAIMGTESAELLVEEYQLMKQVMASGDPKQAARLEARQKALSDSLLKRRDQYIAARINSTLQVGETGMLLLGMFHSLGKWLDEDIHVIYPIYPPLIS